MLFEYSSVLLLPLQRAVLPALLAVVWLCVITCVCVGDREKSVIVGGYRENCVSVINSYEIGLKNVENYGQFACFEGEEKILIGY